LLPEVTSEFQQFFDTIYKLSPGRDICTNTIDAKTS